VPFDNQGGTVDAESGTLQATDGGTNTGGTYIANGSGVINLTGGSNTTFTGTSTGYGTGQIEMTGGTITVGSGGATFNFPSSYLFWTGGSLSGTLTNAATGVLAVGDSPGGSGRSPVL
jgi:hypothetical protein